MTTARAIRTLSLACLLAASALSSGAALAADLTATEQRLVEAVDAHEAEALALLEASVNINSGSYNLAGVRKVGELFAGAFQDAGLETEWVDGSAFDRAGHLVARHGDRGPHFVMIGHLDTVFEPDSPFQRFERLDGDLARGPGVIDMKGGNVIILEALRALDAVGALDEMQVTVVLIGDEESSGRPLSVSRAALTDAARAADIALGFENGDSNPATAVIARRGYTGWQLDVTGTPAHSSQIFREDIGYGASYELARILDGFRTTLAGEPNLTFNPGLVLAGTTVEHDAAGSSGHAFGKPNVIPEHAVASGDLRTLSAAQEASARERMQAVVDDHLAGTTATITFTDGYPPLAPTDGNRRLLSLYDAASRDLGFGAVRAVDPAAAGAADVSFTAGLVDMAIDGLGLMGRAGHTVEETADLSTLPSQTKRAALLMYRIAMDDAAGD